MRRIVLSIFIVFGLVVLSGCQSDTRRLDLLDSDIRELKEENEALKEKISILESGSSGTPLSARIDDLDLRFTELLQKYDDRGDMAYLRANVNGHAVLKTDHGILLIRLEGIKLNVGGEGFVVDLSIGNPTGLTFNQYDLIGDYGSRVPSLLDKTDYSIYNREIEAWQKSLTPFQLQISKPVLPQKWTPLSIVINANSRDDLELIRFKMDIKNAEIDSADPAGGEGSDFTYITVNAESPAASLIKTEYGAFFLVATGSRPSPGGQGTEVDIMIGNPYSFDINDCSLRGTFGDLLPQRKAGEAPEMFRGRLSSWTRGQKPFNSRLQGKIAPGKWSATKLLVPGSYSEVQLLRAQLSIGNVTLPDK